MLGFVEVEAADVGATENTVAVAADLAGAKLDMADAAAAGTAAVAGAVVDIAFADGVAAAAVAVAVAALVAVVVAVANGHMPSGQAVDRARQAADIYM